ncbi:thaumatin-like protein 1 [Impatiens glandulifera]|uniref:thaumatin-like protein 1 n=1 Tax=Impatiens glandulifera TaxID=253017 RepID=UPI001FB0E654|nr:thaumatin-like protein 1 [Impatiens glandulifera]
MGISKAVIFLFLLVIFFSIADVSSSATFTFLNKCGFTVWPGILGNPQLDTTGFHLQKGGYRSIQAPAGWSGRFWGRTGCNFDSSDKGSCTTGDCESGQVECNGSGANPPATLAEFTLGSGSPDFYDVSLVDGFNLPMMVEPASGSGNCGSTGCATDINKWCPIELQTENGQACKSACDAFGTPEYCCSGTYGSPSACQPSVYAHMFKASCPKSYSYAFDDASSTFTCTNADYTITFCPAASTKTWNSTKPNVRKKISSDWSWLVNHTVGESSSFAHPCFFLHTMIILVTAFITAFGMY